MSVTETLKEKVLSGGTITRDEAIALWKEPIEALGKAADEIRRKFCGDSFDMCTIINGKSGRCPEDCKYCAQSAHYGIGSTESYGLLSTEEILKEARYNDEKGVLRFSIVTSGKRLSEPEVDSLCETIRAIKRETSLQVCVSLGLLDEEQFMKLKAAGASRVHCNLETSRRYFPQVCTTHIYEEKIETIRSAERAGLELCSGGIMGLGETAEDRIDMVITARELGVRSVPVNLLNPIKGTPYENNEILTAEEAARCVAVFRFLIPDGNIRLAGGRGLLEDKGKRCFESGANAAISGDMLTTAGITVDTDKKLLDELGYKVRF